MPLLYIGIHPLSAAIAAGLFALAHYPNYTTRATLAKGIHYFAVALFVLPYSGIWPIVVAHVLLDAAALGFKKAIDS